MYHNFFIHLSVDGYLGCFHVLAIINSAENEQWDTCVFFNFGFLRIYASKVMLKILQARLQQYMNRELPDVHAGLRKGRRTRDQIANICWIMKKTRVPEKHLFLLY